MTTVQREGLVNETSQRPIGNRHRGLPVCTAVPQQAALPCTQVGCTGSSGNYRRLWLAQPEGLTFTKQNISSDAMILWNKRRITTPSLIRIYYYYYY